jgi:formate dehydrogenase maturation protein FdhE
MMSGSRSSDGPVNADLKALEQRAEQILKARAAYREMVGFYLTVFRRQIEWRDRLVVHPEGADEEQRRECLREGRPLLEEYDPGLDTGSLLALWPEMKAVFRAGNDYLHHSLDKIDEAEANGSLVPATWLLEQRPNRLDQVADISRQLGVEEAVLATLTRSVTFPHWELVAAAWLPPGELEEWKRFRCPTCGGPPALAEVATADGGGGVVRSGRQRFMHCPFCGTRWLVPVMQCPTCCSTTPGDAKYLFTDEEPELRIDFCESCNHYIKVVDTDKTAGRLHIGLELLASVHLDTIAQDKSLRPLEVPA